MSTFTLRRHYPSEVEYWVSDEGPQAPAPLNVGYTLTVGANTENPLEWRVTVTVNFSGKLDDKDLVKGKVTFVGYFDLPADIPEAERQNFAARHGGGILYNATRELVANISARSPHLLITLPITSFSEVKIDPDAPQVKIRAPRP
jgi:preprotein translocase subunit SecB